MVPERYVSRAFTFDPVTYERLTAMADRGQWSEFVRELVNQEWTRRNGEAVKAAAVKLDTEYKTSMGAAQ